MEVERGEGDEWRWRGGKGMSGGGKGEGDERRWRGGRGRVEVERGKGMSGGGEGERGRVEVEREEGDKRNRRRSQGGREGRMGAGRACGMFSYLACCLSQRNSL